MSGLLLVVAAFGCADNTYKIVEPTNVFAVSPAFVGLDQGTPVQFTATVDAVAVPVTWESSDVAKATVSATGLVTTLAPGFVAITATQTANTANKKSGSLTIFQVFGTAIAKNVPVVLGATTSGQSFLYRIYVPPSKTNFDITLRSGGGDLDIFLKKASPPTNSSSGSDYHSWNGGNTEDINVANPASGTWYILVDVYAGGVAGATLTANYLP